ncbi:MAG: hypothetical protein Q7J26_02840 [Brevundimonas sp.]|uniref:hypothetical protein n=1 Tax=Brevundimonas sp. TaxID=1871086 RepID=UPI0027212E7F|nr:hypothetical protein [Brevundimonas sp.]MDO9607437.1 hypothetical protein [Brevundimonas sp.]
MKPTFSEFSYGFALTNELVGWSELAAAPIFPSLIEEGQEGGGYDVKLDRPGFPLYLQFKRSDLMTRRSAREYKAVKARGGGLRVPYYRFAVTDEAISRQHEMLLALDVAPHFVFYAAPRFHKIEEINEAWAANDVASRSQFIAPQEIGSLSLGPHAVAFDGGRFWTCSEPREIKGLTSRDLLEKLKSALTQDDRPLRGKLSEINEHLDSAERRARARIVEREREAAELAEAARERRRAERQQELTEPNGYDLISHSLAQDHGEFVVSLDDLEFSPPASLPVPTRLPKTLSPEFQQLRLAADTAARTFDAQLVIIQPTS